MTTTQLTSDIQVPQSNPLGCTARMEESEKKIISQQLTDKLHTKLLICRIRFLAHKLTARFWKQTDLAINLPSTVLAAISGTSALSGSNHFLSGVFGLTVAVLTAINTFLQPCNNSNEHSRFAAKYSELRNRIELFLSQNCINDEIARQYNPINVDNDFIERVQQFIEKEVTIQINELEEKSPMPLTWVNRKAQGIVLLKKSIYSNEPTEK